MCVNTHGFWVINIPGSRIAEGGNFRPIYLERYSGHMSEEWAFSITWYGFEEKWIWPCYSMLTVMSVPWQWAVLSVAGTCGWRSEGAHPSHWPFSEGDGFCSVRGSSSSQPSQLQRKCSALCVFLQMCRDDKMSDSNFFPSLFKWHLAFLKSLNWWQ